MPTTRDTSTSINGLADSSLQSFYSDELNVRTIASVKSNPARLINAVYFEGGDILACRSGSFRFSFEGGVRPIELKADELLVIYPGNTVTIDALEPASLLNYVVLNGSNVSAYFDQLGLFDLLHFSAPAQLASFELAQKLAAADPTDPAVLSLITDSVQTFFQSWRQQAPNTFFTAVRLLNRNFHRHVVRLKPALDEMGISRSYLYSLFRRQGLPNPGDFIRGVQLREALWLLRNTTRPIGEVSAAVGFDSPAYFTAFIRRLTGHTPSDIRDHRA